MRYTLKLPYYDFWIQASNEDEAKELFNNFFDKYILPEIKHIFYLDLEITEVQELRDYERFLRSHYFKPFFRP
jgi:hypothetical protein